MMRPRPHHSFLRPAHELLEEARSHLPLPLLLRALNLEHCCRRSCRSPFREDRHPSFGIFERDGRWWWKDHGTGAGGEEVEFLAQWTQSTRKEAFKAYLQMAGVPLSHR